jgi:alpha-galactosidase
MHRSKKIVVIGAGSAEFGCVTLLGMMQLQGLHGFELVLVDIDKERLEAITALARKMNQAWQADMKISSSTDRKEALPGAGYIMLSVAIEREDLWMLDHETGLKYDITHYAENGGPAAFVHTCRNLGIILPILKDIETICPDAVLFDLTNPMQRICTAARSFSKIQTLGVCHQITFGYFLLGLLFRKELGLSFPDDYRFVWTDQGIDDWFTTAYSVMERFEIKAAGINHFTWMLDVRDRNTGEDLYPLIAERRKQLPPTFEPLSQKIFDIFGVMPVSGDSHLTEYVPYTSDAREQTWHRFDIQFYDMEWGKRKREEGWKLVRDILDGRVELDALQFSYSERAEHIIEAIANNRHTYEEALVLPNKGYIANLPSDAIVEVPAIITSDGATGVVVGELPEPIAELCRRQIVINEMTVSAFLNRDRKTVYQLFAIDPMIQDPDVAIQLADEYLKLNKKYIPEFD